MKPRRMPGPPWLVHCSAAVALLSGLQAELVNRWSFNTAPGNAPDGTTVADSVGSATAAVVGINASFDGTSLLLPGTTNGNQTPANIAAYVDLPNGLVSSKTHLSVEIWATPASIKNWQRLFDFGRMASSNGNLPANARGPGALSGEILPTATQAPNNTSSSDDFALAINRAMTADTQRMMARLDGAAELGINAGATVAAGTQYHFVCTFTDGIGSFGSSGGQMAWYRNGTLVSTLDVDFHLSEIQDRNNWLGRSMYSADSNANIAYNEVRIYDHALTPAEISANLAAGPDNLGEPEPVDPPVPDHLWVFNNDADSAVESGLAFTDSIGGMVATLRGNGGALTGTAVRLPGSTNGNQSASEISAYLDLPNGIVSAQSAITFEAWATPLSSKNWQRLFEFGRCATTHGPGAAPGEIIDGPAAPGNTAGHDNLGLTLNNAGSLNSQQLEGQHDGNPPQFTSTTAATTAGTKYHYAFIIEDGVGEFGASGCRASWYRDGVLQNTDDFPFLAADMEDVNNWIGRSLYTADSNSHLALDELRIYRHAITPEEVVASFTAGPDPGAGEPEPPAPARIPESRWSFNAAAGAAPAGTTFTDAASGEAATVRGNGATLSGTALVLPGTTNSNQTAANISAYLDLANGLVSSHDSLTFEAWITPLSSRTWQRIFDFGNCSITSGTGAANGEIIDGPTAPGNAVASDNLFLSLNNAGTLGSHRLESRLNTGTQSAVNTDLSGTTSTGTEYHYVLTVEDGAGASGAAGCQAKWYRNGELQGTLDLNFRLADMEDVNNWIGRSQWGPDIGANIAINELRLYDRALTGGEVLTSHGNGANTSFPPPVAVNDSATIHAGQKVLVDVLANDTGVPQPGTLRIATPPAVGTATVTDGKILYAHDGGSDEPVTFTYRVGNVGGLTADATVTIGFATSLRLTNEALAMPAAPPENSWQLVDALPGLTFAQPICISSIPGDSNRLFVCERMARIQHVPDVTAANPVKNVFLDLQAVVAGRTPAETIANWSLGENGLLGLAFHPNHAANGYFFVAYTVQINGLFYQRVSRFQVSADPVVADPDSEVILLQQHDEVFNHNGGDLHFGPRDGYLYYAAGDEANPFDDHFNSQRINKDFFCGVFRLDVDLEPEDYTENDGTGGDDDSLPPNSHPAVVLHDGHPAFEVPIDNPFVHTSLGGDWDGIHNANDGDEDIPLSTVRTEFWATGLRHTWRMSFDPATGDLWGGDVGQDSYEEVNKIVRGGNYGWVHWEGTRATSFATANHPPRPPGQDVIAPVCEYVHPALAGDANFKGNSVCGGYVYRGTRYPSLVGSYIFCDSVTGHVWQMDTSTGATIRLTGLPGAYGVFSTQGVDPSNKDLLFAAYNNGKIMRLAAGGDVTDGFPATLGETGLFADLTDLSPAPGLLPYEPNVAFWSDHAVKRRWFGIPDATSRMTWSKDGNWSYPAGMLWVKHFDLELSRGNPATKKRVETRVLVKTDSAVYGVSYRWNEAQTDAVLVADDGAEFDIAIDDHGTPHTQRWQIPGRSGCLTCHTPRGGHALSFNTRQLNQYQSINGFNGNQLELLSSNNFLANTPDPVATLERHIRADETQYPLEQRARSYFAVNCSYCHQAGGSVGGFWDGRAHLTLEETGLIHGDADNNGGNPLNKYIVPGDTARSIVLNRMAATNGFGRMPPLGSSEADPANIQLVTEWINSDLPNRPLYDEWRDGFFAANDPDGIRSADPDGDGVTNHDEYLLGNSPVSGGNPWQATVANGNLTFLRRSHRYYAIETSDTLGNWQPWSIPEIDRNYLSNDIITEIPLPVSPSGKRFFRFKVTEP